MLGRFKQKLTNFIENIIVEENKNLGKEKSLPKNNFALDLTDISLPKSDISKFLEYSYQKTVKDFVFVNKNTNGHKTATTMAMDSNIADMAEVCSGTTTSAPNIVYTFFSKFGFIGWQLNALVAQHWLISNACSLANQDCLRNGWNNIFIKKDKKQNKDKNDIDGKEEKQKLLTDLYTIQQQKYKLNEVLLKWAYQRNVYGISFLLPKIDGIDYEKPFNIDGVKKGSLKGFTVIEPYWLMPQFKQEDMTDPTSLNFYMPTWYATSNGKPIHKSHFIIAKRKEVADNLKASYFFGGISLTQELIERVYAAEKSANEAPLLLLTKRLNLYKVQDFKEFFMQPGKFKERLQQLSETRDNQGFLLCDKEDDVKQIDTSLTDFDEIIKQQFSLVSAIARIPVDKLMEQNPTGGLSANGSYNVKNYNQDLNTLQTSVFEPAINRINEIVLKSEFDTKEKVSIVFNPTDNPTEEEIATLNKTKADTTAIYLQNGVITPQEARMKLVEDKTAGYSFLKGVELEEPSEEEKAEIEEMLKKAKGEAPATKEGEKNGQDTAFDDNGEEEPESWITIKGNHIPIFAGQSKEEAGINFLLKQLNKKYGRDIIEISRKIQSGEEFVSNFEKKLYEEYENEIDKIYESFGKKSPRQEYKEEVKQEEKEKKEEKNLQSKEGITEPAKEDIFLNVPYSEKDKAKALGAKWNPQVKKWYIPKGKYNENFIKWEKTEIKKHFDVKEKSEPLTNLTELNDADKEKIEKNKKIFADRESNTYPPTDEARQEKIRISIKQRDGVKIQKDWESDKAIGTDVYFGGEDNKKYRIRIFVPKYILLDNGNVPYDFVTQKIYEAKQKMNKNLQYISGLEDYYGIKKDDIEKNRTQDEKITIEKIFTIIDGKIYEIEEKTKAEDDFDENKINRDDKGRFAEKGTKENNNNFGKEFKGYKGQNAIKKLLEEDLKRKKE